MSHHYSAPNVAFTRACPQANLFPTSYPDNGRKLSDDAADAFLTVITNGRITGDGICPHSDLIAEFPYVGPPHNSARSRADLSMRKPLVESVK